MEELFKPEVIDYHMNLRMETLIKQIDIYRTLGYNYKAANRMMSDALLADEVYVFTWGNAIGTNNSFGFIKINEVKKGSNGHYTVNFNIKVPAEDVRSLNQGSTIANPNKN